MSDLLKMKKIAQEIQQAVSELDEPYRVIAFRVFLENVTRQPEAQTRVKPNSINDDRPVKLTPENNESVDDISARINRTAHPEISLLKTAKDRALFILKIVKDEAGRDGLQPSQITQVLDQVFRLKVTQYAISMALGTETKFVDRKPVSGVGGKAYVYRIMAPGEEYLEKIIKEANQNGP